VKVVCESCNTRYAIADDKVRGKSFKIKCKKCGAYIVVRASEVAAGELQAHTPEEAASRAPEGAETSEEISEEKETRVFNYAEFEKLMAEKAEEPAPAAVVASSAALPSSEPKLASTFPAGGAPEWYLLIGEDQQGPLDVGEVDARIRRGEVDGETYAWREGLADWRPLREIDALAPLLSAAPSALDTEQTRAEPIAAVYPGPAPVRVSPDLFGAAHADYAPAPAAAAVPVQPEIVAPPPPEPAGEKKMTAMRHEDSVLFSLKTLGVVSFGEGKEAGPKVVAEPAGAAPADLGPVVLPMGGPRDVPLPPAIVVPTARRGMSSGAKVGIAAAIVLVLGGGAAAAYFLTREPEPAVRRGAPQPPAPVAVAPTPGPSQPGPPAAGPAAPGQPAVAAAGPKAQPGAVPAAAAQEEEEEEVVDRGRRRGVRRKKRRPETVAAAPATSSTSEPSAPSIPDVPQPREEEPPARREELEPPRPPRSADSEIKAILEGRTKPPPRPAPEQPAAPREDPSLPETLEKGQVHKVIRRNLSGIVRCYNNNVSDKASKKGTLNVSFTIKGSGRTSGVRVARPDFWGGDLVGCVGNVVSRWRFPKFRGEEIEISYPFILGGF
jgi:predicted Zn finger-like uncharacterized protein